MNQTKRKKSVTLIEAVIDMALLAFISVIVITSLLAGLRSAQQSAEMASAAQLANQQMEDLHNLSYTALATKSGIIFPQGNIPDYQTVNHDNFQLTIHTQIIYVDDPYDGTANSNPPDLDPADYKKITVTVSDAVTGVSLASITTDIASRAAETSSNTGILDISVLNASGQPVSNATVNIINTTIQPNITMSSLTQQNGTLFIPNLPPSSGYHVVVTKSGYSTDYTSPITTSNPEPTNPDASVLSQQVTTVTLNIDLLSQITIELTGNNGNPISATFTGQKIIGNNPANTPTSIPKTQFTQNINNGTVINNLEYDSYNVTLNNGWYFTTCSPYQPFDLSPNTNLTVSCSVTQDNTLPRIVSITPTTANNTDSAASFEIDGYNFASNATVTIQSGTNSSITLPNLTVSSNGTVISGTVDFTSIPLGTYNVTVSNSQTSQTTQANGLIIVQATSP